MPLIPVAAVHPKAEEADQADENAEQRQRMPADIVAGPRQQIAEAQWAARAGRRIYWPGGGSRSPKRIGPRGRDGGLKRTSCLERVCNCRAVSLAIWRARSAGLVLRFSSAISISLLEPVGVLTVGAKSGIANR